MHTGKIPVTRLAEMHHAGIPGSWKGVDSCITDRLVHGDQRWLV